MILQIPPIEPMVQGSNMRPGTCALPIIILFGLLLFLRLLVGSSKAREKEDEKEEDG